MSGTGIPDFLAPTLLTPVAGDQAIGKSADGGDVMPSMYFTQMIQRMLAFLGQPATSAEGVTLSEQVVSATDIATAALQMASSASGVALNLAALFENITSGTLPPSPPPTPPVPAVVSLALPLAPPPGLSFPQVMAIRYFGF